MTFLISILENILLFMSNGVNRPILYGGGCARLCARIVYASGSNVLFHRFLLLFLNVFSIVFMLLDLSIIHWSLREFLVPITEKFDSISHESRHWSGAVVLGTVAYYSTFTSLPQPEHHCYVHCDCSFHWLSCGHCADISFSGLNPQLFTHSQITKLLIFLFAETQRFNVSTSHRFN